MIARNRGRGLCGVKGKEIWDTKAEAKGALAGHGRAAGSKRVYRCPFCNGWHATKGGRGRSKGGG
jgi:hypothetical protein